MAKPKLTKQRIIEAIPKAHGIKQAIADRLGVSRMTIHRYFEKHPELEEVALEYIEVVNDKAEHHLIKAVMEGNSWAVRYWLSTRGKHRGYSTKLESTFNSSNPMQTIGISIEGKPMQIIRETVAGAY